MAKYALSPDPKGQARGGTVGARYAAAQLGIPEPQSVREWMKRLPEMEEALERAQLDGGEMGSRHVRRKKSMSRGRVRAFTVTAMIVPYDMRIAFRVLLHPSHPHHPGTVVLVWCGTGTVVSIYISNNGHFENTC